MESIITDFLPIIEEFTFRLALAALGILEGKPMTAQLGLGTGNQWLAEPRTRCGGSEFS
jgi:hypothetical protein